MSRHVRPPRQNKAGELAEQHFAAGRLPEAEAAYRKSLKAEPANGTLANNFANLLTSTGRPAEAIPLYRRGRGRGVGRTPMLLS